MTAKISMHCCSLYSSEAGGRSRRSKLDRPISQNPFSARLSAGCSCSNTAPIHLVTLRVDLETCSDGQECMYVGVVFDCCESTTAFTLCINIILYSKFGYPTGLEGGRGHRAYAGWAADCHEDVVGVPGRGVALYH